MQRKTLLSACIALALSGQGWAADITEIETTTGEKKNTNVTCPADPGKLSPEELKRLPSECSSVVEQNLMPWLVTGAATALITTLAIVELNDDDDHHRNNSPLPPTPPDDDSDDTPVPPTPGGDEIIPDDGPDDTPTPPKPIAFNNDVILDKTEKTLTIRDSVFSYTENADGTISLQDSNGRKATINLWQIDETNKLIGDKEDAGKVEGSTIFEKIGSIIKILSADGIEGLVRALQNVGGAQTIEEGVDHLNTDLLDARERISILEKEKWYSDITLLADMQGNTAGYTYQENGAAYVYQIPLVTEEDQIDLSEEDTSIVVEFKRPDRLPSNVALTTRGNDLLISFTNRPTRNIQITTIHVYKEKR